MIARLYVDEAHWFMDAFVFTCLVYGGPYFEMCAGSLFHVVRLL